MNNRVPYVSRNFVRIGRNLRKFNYVFTGRVFDGGSLTATTVPDLSPFGNDGILYTGKFVSSNGSTDKLLNAITDLPSGNYYLGGWVRSATTGTKYALIGNTAVTFTITSANVWEYVETTVASGVTPSIVTLAWDGGSNFSACDWSDWKLFGNAKVPRWQLNESGAASLDGYPAFDSSGNGYHGTHDGGAGGDGEGDILQTAGLDWNKRMWFDGSDDYVAGTPTNFASSQLSITFFYTDDQEAQILQFSDGSTYSLVFTINSTLFGNNDIVIQSDNSGGSSGGTVWRYNGLTTGTFVTLVANFNASNQITSATVNGNAMTTAGSGISRQITSTSAFRLGIRTSAAFEYRGLITDFSLAGLTWDGSNQGAVDNGWTVRGSPSNLLLPESDTTAGEDALGNTIDVSRPNSRVFNGFDSSVYGLIEDDASLDSQNVFACWFYYDGQDGTIVDYSDGAGTVKVETDSDNLVAKGLTSPTYYVGTKTTAAANTAALTANAWNYIAVTFSDFTPTADEWLYRRIGHVIQYTESKDLATFERNRKSTKNLYE